jgi:Mn-dependent DtxR family transcriptional regulator
VLPSVEHTVVETFPLGTDEPPDTRAIAQISGYRLDQVRPTLARLAAEGLVEAAGSGRWILTVKGRQLRAMLRTGDAG